MVKTLVMFNVRSPDGIGHPPKLIYSEALKMAQFADKAGFDYVTLSEHHGVEDGYLPAPFVLGGAFAACTERIRILLNAIVLPLHNPINIAEQIAVLDIISNGRLEVVFGAGYRRSEFERFGVPFHQRGRLLDVGLETVLHALSGARYDPNGKDVFIRPLPLQRPHPQLYVGGGVPASAKRAARLGLGFAPMKAGLFELYSEECHKLGRAPGPQIGMQDPIMVHVTEDPDQAWAALKPHLLHVVDAYAKWAAEGNDASPYTGLADFDAIRRSSRYAVVTPDECFALAAQLDKANAPLCFQPMIGGLSPEEGWRSLRLFAEKVMPRLPA